MDFLTRLSPRWCAATCRESRYVGRSISSSLPKTMGDNCLREIDESLMEWNCYDLADSSHRFSQNGGVVKEREGCCSRKCRPSVWVGEYLCVESFKLVNWITGENRDTQIVRERETSASEWQRYHSLRAFEQHQSTKHEEVPWHIDLPLLQRVHPPSSPSDHPSFFLVYVERKRALKHSGNIILQEVILVRCFPFASFAFKHENDQHFLLSSILSGHCFILMHRRH